LSIRNLAQKLNLEKMKGLGHQTRQGHKRCEDRQ
jgi:hypothetical protein